MQGGDLSNETPPRIYFTLDVVSTSKVETKKKVLGLITTTTRTFEWDLARLQQVWNLTSKYALIAELVAFEYTQEEVDKIIDELDERGINPFNYGTGFPSVESLIEQIPYRFNLKGVVDIPSRVARYGSWGIEIDNL